MTVVPPTLNLHHPDEDAEGLNSVARVGSPAEDALCAVERFWLWRRQRQPAAETLGIMVPLLLASPAGSSIKAKRALILTVYFGLLMLVFPRLSEGVTAA